MRYALGALDINGLPVSDENIALLSIWTGGVPAGKLRELIDYGDMWVAVEPQGPIYAYGATTIDAAGALADAIITKGGLDPIATGTTDAQINRALMIIDLLGVPFTDINDGTAFARYGVSDPVTIAAIQAAARHYEEWKDQSRTARRRSMQKAITMSVLAAGAAFGATALYGGAFGSGASASQVAENIAAGGASAQDIAASYAAMIDGGATIPEVTAMYEAAGFAPELIADGLQKYQAVVSSLASSSASEIAQQVLQSGASKTLPALPSLTSSLPGALSAAAGAAPAVLRAIAGNSSTPAQPGVYATPQPKSTQSMLLLGALGVGALAVYSLLKE